jgi:Mrp family chromosome partitioning ATPase
MKPFALPKPDALPANEEKMPGRAERAAPNDLRSYLQRRPVLLSRDLAKEPGRDAPAPPKPAQVRIGPVLKSLDAVLHHVSVRATEDTTRAVLVIAARPEIDASGEAIHLARAQASHWQRGVLVDLTHGGTLVADPLGLPHAPGFAELAAGRASFDKIIHVDDETPLQVIPAGNPTVRTEKGNERLARIFEALAQTYDFIVLHADRVTARTLESVLAGRLHSVVAVLAPGEGKSSATSLAALTAFGCPILPYEQTAKRRKFSWSFP